MWPTVVLALLAAAAHLQLACASALHAHHARGSPNPCTYSCPTSDATPGSLISISSIPGTIECYYNPGFQVFDCYYYTTSGDLDIGDSDPRCATQAVANCSRRRRSLRRASRPRTVAFEELPQDTDIIVEDDQQPW